MTDDKDFCAAGLIWVAIFSIVSWPVQTWVGNKWLGICYLTLSAAAFFLSGHLETYYDDRDDEEREES